MKKRKIYIILSVCIVAIILAVGYTVKNNSVQKDTNISAENSDKSIKGQNESAKGQNGSTKASDTSAKGSDKSTKSPDASKPSAPNMNKVKDLTQELANEKQVSGSQIYESNNMHYAVITFKDDADSKNAKKFATKYANLIKEAYNDKNVNVKIVQKGKDIANVVLE